MYEGFKRNIYSGWDKEPFWGRYSALNSASVPSKSAIQNFQKAKMQELSRQAAERVKNKNLLINQLIESGQINSLPGKYVQQEDVHLDQAITNIVKILNSSYGGRTSSKKNGVTYKYDYFISVLGQLKSAIESLSAVIEANGGIKIPSSYIDKLDALLSQSELNSTNIDEWISKINQYKGDLVEDIGVSWLSALKIPNVATLNTGSLEYRGSGKFGRKGQLIQDLITLDYTMSGVNSIEDVPIEYRDLEGNQVSGTIGSMLQALEKANGQYKHIALNDEGYETLLKLSVLNVQAKSGLNQKLWNEGLSTSVSIGEFSDADGLALSARHIFELLHSLDQENIPEKDIWVYDTSADYNALANYGLGTVLAKVLHLEENGNDYVLTPSGFTSFATRMEQLMNNRNSYVNIKGQVTINDNTLGVSYPVGMVGYN